MADSSPFSLIAWDKNLTRLGYVGNPISVKVTPRHWQIGTLELTVPITDRLLPALTLRGGRITCDYRGEQILSGPRRPLNGQGPTAAGTVTITYEDDIRLLWRLLGYPTPGNATPDANGGLTQPDLQDKRTGPAETVVKGYIAANATRDPRPIVVAPSLERGSTITAALRMVPLADQLVDLADAAGIGLTVRQTTTGLLVDCYTPSTFPRKLTEAGGALRSWSFSETPPSATTAIVGGPNTGTSREFKRVDNPERRDDWGDLIEVPVDASSQTLSADIVAAGTTALDAADSKSGFSVTLGETSTFHYGGDGGIHVGDLATINVFGQDRTEVVREAVLAWTRSDGFSVTPAIGDHSDDPNKSLLSFIQQLARGLRAVRTR